MLIWLASFPRSGNSLLRTIFNRCFGLATYSKYECTNDYTNAEIATFMGACPYEGRLDEFLAMARSSDAVTVVKTHEGPESDDPAIYIVRNGLIATDSYRHYLEKIENVKFSWNQIVDGVSFPTWSEHIERWSPMTRPNTLFLRYEDILSSSGDKQIERIAEFTGLSVQNKWRNPFDTLHKMGKNYFRRGKVTVPWSIARSEKKYFMEKNKIWMDRLNYSARCSLLSALKF